MIRKALLAASVLTLAACTTPKDLSMYGEVKLDGNYLNSITDRKPQAGPAEKLPFCVASIVQNDPIQLTDSSRSFVGAYTRTLYYGGTNVEVGGGSVIQFVSPDQSQVVAKGATEFTSSLVARSARYTLTIKPAPAGGREYRFSGIQQAQMSTGMIQNNGYSPVHVLAGGGSEDLAASLHEVSESIETCTKQ